MLLYFLNPFCELIRSLLFKEGFFLLSNELELGEAECFFLYFFGTMSLPGRSIVLPFSSLM